MLVIPVQRGSAAVLQTSAWWFPILGMSTSLSGGEIPDGLTMPNPTEPELSTNSHSPERDTLCLPCSMAIPWVLKGTPPCPGCLSEPPLLNP